MIRKNRIIKKQKLNNVRRNQPDRDFGERSFHIVGIGASAGGMEALKQFFTNMPPDNGMGFVIVTHLDPTHKGMMPELIQRYTKMPVAQAEDGMRVQPNKVYIIPPNKFLSILHGTLQLFDIIDPQPLRLPIDYFFRQLALDQLDRAVGIILSGMGTDGTLGIRAVKEKMGLVMVQDPRSAEFNSMPKSAIETNLVDYVAPAEKLPEELLSYRRGFAAGERKSISAGKHDTALNKIFILLREQTGHDFSGYKNSTIFRRVERRVNVHKLAGIDPYVRFLQENKQEVEILFKELLIGVTSFFRDPQAWQELKVKLLKDVDVWSKEKEFRVWVAGCSSGEEAYSMAIIIRECLETKAAAAGVKVNIYATDIDKNSIERARQGKYPKNIAADIDPERLRKYFSESDDVYQIKPVIREMVVFAPQNLIMDPPFTKLDLICCRNLLIYLTSEMQKKLIRLFHFVLKPAGTLFLGSSESLGGLSGLFTVISNNGKLFARKYMPYSRVDLSDLPTLAVGRGVVPKMGEPKTAKDGRGTAELAERLLLDRYSPPAVLINECGDIVFVSGSTGKYLELPLGKANINIYAMARAGLREEVSAAIRRALSRKEEILVPGLKVKSGNRYQIIDLIVKPLTRPENVAGLLLIVFKESAAGPVKTEKVKRVRGAKHGERLTELEEELKILREKLQNTVQDMETTQEELKSANEELQSTNEELQSTNEELTTSKEEMQSTNEELMTVNAELEAKNNELTQTSNDMKNLLDSTDIATLFLDNDLNIKRYTPQATKIINLLAGDVGRSVADLVPTLKYQELERDAREVLEKLEKKEIEVETKDGKWYIMRIIPYRTSSNVIDGVVITFTNITRFRSGGDCLRRKINER
ncbi:MAG: PAS domain-containing protein [Candidatus Margulisbacteria bacterium]|nr:PAS domain-containing protein [Candidatus Margulisiibacteriota bacterium]